MGETPPGGLMPRWLAVVVGVLLVALIATLWLKG